MRRWNASEDAQIFDSDKKDPELSRLLGRSRLAIRSRRFYLRHPGNFKAKTTSTLVSALMLNADGTMTRVVRGI